MGKENDGHVITQDEYNEKTAAIVSAIRKQLKEPDVIAVQEVAVFATGENALTGLAAALGNYTPYIATNNDGRGVAPGFLVKTGTTAANGDVIGEEKTSPWGSTAVCDLHPGPLFDRAPYKLEVKKGDLALTVLSNHFASQSHQNACRISEAEYVQQQAAAMQAAGKNVLVAGDLNDFEFSDTLAKLAEGGTLTNLWTKAPAGLAYSYKFNGHLQTLDHILVTAGLNSRVTDMRYVHLDNDVYERYLCSGPTSTSCTTDTTQGVGLSDHDPPVATFTLGASTSVPGTVTGTVPATLALTLGTAAPLGPFTPGVAKDYTTTMTATATSTGADAALSVIDPSSTATGPARQRHVRADVAAAGQRRRRCLRAAADRQRTAGAGLVEHADHQPQRAARLQAVHRRDRGPAYGQLRQDADVHAVDDLAVIRTSVGRRIGR